jgi:hypothetical protein
MTRFLRFDAAHRAEKRGNRREKDQVFMVNLFGIYTLNPPTKYVRDKYKRQQTGQHGGGF